MEVRRDARGLRRVCDRAREVLQRAHEVRVDHAEMFRDRLERRREEAVELGVVYQRDDDLALGACVRTRVCSGGDRRGAYRVRVRVRDARRGGARGRRAINTSYRTRRVQQMSVAPPVVSSWLGKLTQI